MSDKDIIKFIGIVKNANECQKKLIKFGEERTGKPRVLDVDSEAYYLYEEWAISLSNLIDDIEKTKYLFDLNLYNELEKYFDSIIKIDDKYLNIASEIDWNNYKKTRRNKITLRILLDAFRDKKTHSIKYDKEAEYKLFCLNVDEIILVELFNLCGQIINAKINKMTCDERSKFVKLSSDIIVKFYKIQEFFSNSAFQKAMGSLDDKVFKQQKDIYNNFLNSKLNKNNIVLEKSEEEK